jgi:hypothetical protein
MLSPQGSLRDKSKELRVKGKVAMRMDGVWLNRKIVSHIRKRRMVR